MSSSSSSSSVLNKPQYGNPAKYEGTQVPIIKNNTPRIYGPPPPESIESQENMKKRKNKESLFRKLNNLSPQFNTYRNSFRKRYGQNWKNIGQTYKKQFQNKENAKAQQRFNILKEHRDREWDAYVTRFLQEHPPVPGQPKVGPPPRVSSGYGGGKTRKRRHSRYVRK